MIEAEVHYSLHNFLRSQGEASWHHHLTMARLVARGLRLKRSALIQVGAGSGYQGRYRLSYLAPALMWQEAVIIVAPEEVQQRLLRVEIPPLQQWLQTEKQILTSNSWADDDFQGLLLTSPASWLEAQLAGKGFPSNIPTILDGVDDLEAWTRTQLTATIQPSDWDELMLAFPKHVEAIRDARVQLTKAIFQHPVNPYECYLSSQQEQDILYSLDQTLAISRQSTAPQRTDNHDSEPSMSTRKLGVPHAWRKFWQLCSSDNQLLWATVARSQGSFSLHSSPVEVASTLAPIWSRQPVVLVGSALDQETEAPIYRKNLGLGELTCLKFSDDRRENLIQLYLPDRLPLPNTPEFQTAFIEKVHSLLSLTTASPGLTVILVGDVPLKAQVGAALAAEFGSRVQVEKTTSLDQRGILIAGWEFWRQHLGELPTPQLLIVATLPLPSLENPLVAGRVAYYKRKHQDWFRLYLLPAALNELSRAIAPVRERHGVVALLDSRVLHRSYGSQVLAALSPMARIDYLDSSLLTPAN
ncbi:helicase C-terminal domain-containing protein [Chroococcidiopsis sp. TS-821]|uniref:helicase C-terminal domain-containing protein n=1 Tax=Chroococcidiopsis sp. TS-821 TaxID=1378066 RepID=UPI000CEDC1FB|nr:helicase C-terminal domain-containing protein [Chroococcidiopsis sp. TS-821]PPS40629.1 helicase [Chroococcidiopsis sp. TS-821]